MARTYRVKLSYPAEKGTRSFAIDVTDPALHPLALRLRYVVANRLRITDDSRQELEDLVEREVREILRDQDDVCAALDEHLLGIGKAGAVEVEIPFMDEGTGWAARMMPWENVLGLMTRRYRSKEPLLVVRFLNVRGGSSPRSRAKSGRKLLVVQASPGHLGERYHLSEECEQVRDGFEDKSISGNGRWEKSLCLNNPTADELAEQIGSPSFFMAHIAAVSAATVVQEARFEASQIEGRHGPLLLDAIVMRSKGRAETDSGEDRAAHPTYAAVDPLAMASLLVNARIKAGSKSRAGLVPLELVTFSSNFSAPRQAALAVGHRAAHHAIGIQDGVTEEQCGQFFGGFYSDLDQDGENLLAAFLRARKNVARNYDLGAAAGFVLWSDKSMLGSLREVVQAGTTPPPGAAGSRKPASDPDSFVSYWVKPVTRLNYSLLHNDQPIFEQFSVLKVKKGCIAPLRVEVSLDTGGSHGRAVSSVTLPRHDSKYVYRLADKIQLPLVAELIRSCQESIRTALHVRLECGDEVLLEQNYPVRVLPADEWRDDGRDHCWLPSFVLPRDEAVVKIFGCAQRCLRILADDAAAAFDGYQSVDASRAHPGESVDLQVKAIWAAIQHDLQINYINPPPSYGTSSQRLRTPSQIMQGRSATCIDLALLFCACLEYAGIYPVVFLIEGHAFPGYWRSEHAWWDMVSFRRALRLADQSGLSEKEVAVCGSAKGWMLEGERAFAEIMSFVEEGSLVPFESTFATVGRRLADALAEAPRNLSAETFDCMVDVWSARVHRVTPLPLSKFIP